MFDYSSELLRITVNDDFVRVEHPDRKTLEVNWDDIEEIWLLNTDQGPFLDDIWLQLKTKDHSCYIPQGREGYNDVYDKVTQYPGFNFDNVILSMQTTTRAEFLLWTKPQATKPTS